MAAKTSALLPVPEAARALGVSVATVWRAIRRGGLASIRERGRRLVRIDPKRTRGRVAGVGAIPPFGPDHPIFRLVGAGRSGGRGPGARDKRAILAE